MDAIGWAIGILAILAIPPTTVVMDHWRRLKDAIPKMKRILIRSQEALRQLASVQHRWEVAQESQERLRYDWRDATNVCWILGREMDTLAEAILPYRPELNEGNVTNYPLESVFDASWDMQGASRLDPNTRSYDELIACAKTFTQRAVSAQKALEEIHANRQFQERIWEEAKDAYWTHFRFLGHIAKKNAWRLTVYAWSLVEKAVAWCNSKWSAMRR
ncbi:MAG: hypothetical protein AB1733_15750 [Thermodesulfobacteriota bacterium]